MTRYIIYVFMKCPSYYFIHFLGWDIKVQSSLSITTLDWSLQSETVQILPQKILSDTFIPYFDISYSDDGYLIQFFFIVLNQWSFYTNNTKKLLLRWKFYENIKNPFRFDETDDIIYLRELSTRNFNAFSLSGPLK